MDANARRRAGERAPSLTNLPDLVAGEAQAVVANCREAVPVPPIGTGTGNRSPEPSGTVGTAPLTFEPLAAFLERTRSLPPVCWLVADVVPEAGRLLIVAAPNAGKTWLAFVIAKEAAALGRRVFAILEEGGPKPTANRFEDLAIPEDAPIDVAHCRGFLLGDAESRLHLVERLRGEDAPVLILDPLVSMFRGDENDTREMNQVRAHLEELAQANPKALIVLLHHTSKAGERGEGAAVYAGRGSTVLGGWADVTLNLRHEQSPKGEERVFFSVLVAKNRDGERDYRVRCEVSLGDGLVSFAREDGSQSTELRNAIREALKASKEPPSATALARRLSRRKEDVLRAVKELEEEGALQRMGKGYRCTESEGNDEEERES
ncbi:AAA family ATPase [Myxococcus xanthus]|uniref:AAA family ATPase n=1 Tax=Myxococcus xanthus TaxID=34 RepID=UPI0013758DAB|nr:AAA family ATPase [Myxococcus xanthus]